MSGESKIAPRSVEFDFDRVPVHWVGDRPFLTHLLNALHFLFEHGERWFCDAFRETLPQIQDTRLLGEVRGFIAQEATHSHHHARFLARLDSQGLNLPGVSELIKRELARWQRWASLHSQVAMIAGIEQYTAMLGAWIFAQDTLRDADPVMRDLFLWHSAEEIEHKSVAFDLLQALRPGYFYRVAHFAVASTSLFVAWGLILMLLIWRDKHASLREVLVDFARALRDGDFPLRPVLRGAVRYLKPGFHPREDDNLHLWTNYFASRAGS